ncbi:flippase [Cytobacillus firmus]|uniref:flippase n=1 Tax=Cytobacillus firmus TaxID=1399 RepID=UPI0021C721C3|nr:flippase [Cytobacillus firmus]MCU1807115.1 flippase [Cytobacillus firmus]
MNRLIKNYIYNIFYQIFIIIVPLITAPYLVRVLGAEEIGVYSYINSVSSIVSTLGLIGLNSYSSRQIAYYRNDKSKLTQTFFELMYLRLLLCVLITIFYFIFINNSEYTTLYSLQYFLILAIFMDVSWFFIGIEKMGIVVLRNFIAKFITVISIFIFIRNEEDLWIYIFVFAISTFITTLSIYPQLRRYLLWTKVSFESVLGHIIPSLRLFLPQIAILIYTQVGRIMIKYLTNSTEQIAFYDQAEKIVMMPLALITALSTVMMPRLANEFSNNNFNRLNNILSITLKFMLLTSFPMAAGIAGIAFWFIPWYLGDEFHPVILAIIVLSPIIITNSLANVAGNQYYTATNQTNILTIAYVSAAVINILTNYLLIPSYGYIGAAIATLISSTISVVIQYYYLSKVIEFIEFFRHALKYIAVSLFMGVVIIAIGYVMDVSVITTLTQIFIGIIIYFTLLALIRDKTFLFVLKKILVTFKLVVNKF